MRLHDENRKVYNCQICKKPFSSKGSLTRHLGIHTCEKKYACGQCKRTFNQNAGLKRHLCGGQPLIADVLLPADPVLEPFSCEKCDFSSKKKRKLKNHLLVHSGMKLFNCNKCDYVSTISTNLKVHMLTHTGEKTFTYDKCDYKAATPSNLKIHMIKHNENRKAYSCEICNRDFSHASSLKRHIEVHNDVSNLLIFNVKRLTPKTKV